MIQTRTNGLYWTMTTYGKRSDATNTKGILFFVIMTGGIVGQT